ncbi:MAG: protein arginine kinase [Chlamydiae bacterium]|nr:MAG: protein arginine kinase [Chlamydiota bacterium]
MFEKMIHHRPPWLVTPPKTKTIAISSRIRLARNMSDLPFPGQCNDEQRVEVISRVVTAAKTTSLLRKANVLKLDSLSQIDKQFLVERHLVSPEFIQQETPATVIISDDETCSLMVNEEDHIRMQVLRIELNLEEAWEMINQLDSELEKSLPYAFSSKYGYLTACPTNVGTGLRASAMLHLPALVHEHKIGSVMSAVGKIGIAVRGLYGESSESKGNMFQISNQVTLGQDEENIVNQLHQIVLRIIEHENKLRDALIINKPHQIKNDVGRAYGTLKYAEILTSEEATELLSSLLIGTDLQVFDKVDRTVVNELLIDIQPAHLQKMYGKKLTAEQRNLYRAKVIRERL